MSITRLSGGSSLNSNLPCSVPLSDVMAPLLRMCDQTEVSKMNSQMTASYIDQNVSDLMITSEWASNPLQGSKGVDYDGLNDGFLDTSSPLYWYMKTASGAHKNCCAKISIFFLIFFPRTAPS